VVDEPSDKGAGASTKEAKVEAMVEKNDSKVDSTLEEADVLLDETTPTRAKPPPTTHTEKNNTKTQHKPIILHLVIFIFHHLTLILS